MTHVANVVIDSTKVSADATDFVVYVDLNDLPTTEFWGTVADGGGDIRVYKSDGNTELAREVVSCNTATDTGELWIKYSGTLSSSVDTTIQIHADGTSSEPTSGDAGFSQNVWTNLDYVGLDGGHGLNDSSGTVSPTESGTVSSVAGPIDDASDYPGGNLGHIELGTANFQDQRFSVSGWLKMGSAGDGPIFSRGTDQANSNYGWHISVSNGALRFAYGSSVTLRGWYTGTNTFANETWTYFEVGRVADNTIRFRLNGAVEDITTANEAINHPAGYTTKIGYGPFLSSLNGSLAIVSYRPSAPDDDWGATEYNNQSAPNTFYTASAPSGGGGISIPIAYYYRNLFSA